MASKEDEPVFVLSPDLVNALVPSLIKNFLISLGISILVYLFFSLLTFISKAKVYGGALISTIIVVFLIFLIIPFLINMFILKFTKYEFYSSNIVKQFKFIMIKKHAIIYDKILEVKLDISIWDRLTKAGDIQLVSADDSSPNLVLKYIKEPEKVEKNIYQLIRKVNKTTRLTLRQQ